MCTGMKLWGVGKLHEAAERLQVGRSAFIKAKEDNLSPMYRYGLVWLWTNF
jgi:hypothetical protein